MAITMEWSWINIFEGLKVTEPLIEKCNRDLKKIDKMQLGPMPGAGRGDAIFIIWEMQEKYLAKPKICI